MVVISSIHEKTENLIFITLSELQAFVPLYSNAACYTDNNFSNGSFITLSEQILDVLFSNLVIQFCSNVWKNNNVPL